ncbi:MAG: hypothetical protein Unbinned1473contig1002_45 [Prokaryotic dsDNA virus sp.]|nr:MAG: hypothetical protein Unbinned1473contig1002_45 [Prokaryotic dsDNA virus sp.]|tara:strand:- start:6201 stop:6743 length:543 start_codon:yes stop_codon:yes gene_type:complete
MGAISRIERTIKNAGAIAEKKIRNQLKIVRPGNAKRMSTTHELSRSLKSEIAGGRDGRVTLVVTTPNKYGKILDDGVNPLKVPYSVGTKAGHSDYIEGLARWAAKKFHGGNLKKGLKTAFKIARTQKGIAESGSYEGSPKSPGYIKEIKKDIDKELVEYFTRNVMMAIQKDAHRILNRTI